MAKELSRDTLQQLARLGAVRRLEELRAEQAAILAAFPGLEGARRGRPRGGATAGDGAESTRTPKGRRRWKMSAAQKRAVSERMKKYWAGRRKSKG